MSVPDAQAYHYQRHEPEKSTLCRLIQANWLTFEQQVEQDLGYPLPDFVIKEFEEYLRCGILAHGFLRALDTKPPPLHPARGPPKQQHHFEDDFSQQHFEMNLNNFHQFAD